MENKSSSLSNQVRKNINQNNLKPIGFFFGFVAISILIAFLIGGYLIGKNNTKKENQDKSVSVKEQIKLNPKNLPSNPGNWTTYKFGPLKIGFKLPEELSKTQQWDIFELKGDEGKIICFSDQKLTNEDLCSGEILIIGSASNNFSSAKTLSYIYNHGFTEENGIYYLTGINNQKIKIENSKLKKFNNSEFEILKILGSESNSTPKSGFLGAVVNTKNSTYPALILIMKIDSEIYEYEFDQILKSIKTIND